MIRLVLVLTASLLALAAACGGDDGPECTGLDFDCEVACANLEDFCNTCDEPADDCQDDACVEDCERARSDPDAIPAEFRPLVLGELNCLDDSDTCEEFSSCLRQCLQ